MLREWNHISYNWSISEYYSAAAACVLPRNSRRDHRICTGSHVIHKVHSAQSICTAGLFHNVLMMTNILFQPANSGTLRVLLLYIAALLCIKPIALPVNGIDASLPVADYSTSSASGTAPLPVTFMDESLNTPTSWEWDFKTTEREIPLTRTQRMSMHHRDLIPRI